MTNVVHANLTGADLHEPKGISTATANCVYVSNGSGSGSWVTAASVITNQAFTTGDAKLTLKTSADSGWIIVDDGTIGDGSSGASTRANADTSALFTLLWGLPANLTVSGGRGANAAADYAAHKTINLPKSLGRALVVAGSGSGLTARILGGNIGAETATLVTANLPPYTPSGSVSSSSSGFVSTQGFSGANQSGLAAGVGNNNTSTFNVAVTISTSSSFSGSAQGGTSTPFSIKQPDIALNIMVKL